jgi:hypothetical protein
MTLFSRRSFTCLRIFYGADFAQGRLRRRFLPLRENAAIMTPVRLSI